VEKKEKKAAGVPEKLAVEADRRLGGRGGKRRDEKESRYGQKQQKKGTDVLEKKTWVKVTDKCGGHLGRKRKKQKNRPSCQRWGRKKRRAKGTRIQRGKSLPVITAGGGGRARIIRSSGGKLEKRTHLEKKKECNWEKWGGCLKGESRDRDWKQGKGRNSQRP